MPWFTGWTSPWLAVGRHHDGSTWSARTTVLGLQPADDPHFYHLDNTGTLFCGLCGPGGGPYGRREHGRFRRSDGRNTRDGKGVKDGVEGVHDAADVDFSDKPSEWRRMLTLNRSIVVTLHWQNVLGFF